MSNQENAGDRPFVMVLALDLADQDSSGYAFDQAMRIASRIDRNDVHVLYVMAEDATPERVRESAELLQLYVAEKAAALAMRGPQRAGIHVRCGDSAKEIAQLSADIGADMIVVGAGKAAHLSGLWLGSTAERVMAVSPLPVFVAGPRPKPRPSHVIVIEPPCPDCVQQRLATQGRVWWCERHSENHHLRRHHIYSYQSDFPFAQHDSAILPTGTG
jgi:nucleotide-binding universal stress UspA family protein